MMARIGAIAADVETALQADLTVVEGDTLRGLLRRLARHPD